MENANAFLGARHPFASTGCSTGNRLVGCRSSLRTPNANYVYTDLTFLSADDAKTRYINYLGRTSFNSGSSFDTYLFVTGRFNCAHSFRAIRADYRT